VPLPVLVACSHGTRDPAGRRTIHALLDGVQRVRPDLDVREAFVDVQEPEVADVVAEALGEGEDRAAVVVPLLLSAGYHVHVDIARAVAAHPGRAVAAPALGPDSRVVAVLARRLAEAGAREGDAVVVAAAGSSDVRASEAVEEVAAELRQVHWGPVAVGYGSAARPNVPDAVAAARAAGAERVVIASYLLAPGYFHDRLAEAGADVVTDPLAPDDRLVDVVLDRYGTAAALLAGGTRVVG
jgi:sirohydrochlorin ferrochelatase